MTPDHEAAKKLAKALIEAGCQGEHHANLVNAYLDLVAREQRAVAAERERDALKAIFGKCTGRFARVRGQCEPVEGYAERPNDILRSIDDLCEHIAALKQRVAELERELEAARNVCEAAGVVIDDTRNASYADCCVNKGKVCDLLAVLAAYRATKEPRDEAK